MAQQLAGTLITLLSGWFEHHYPHGPEVMEEQRHELVKNLH
jgi:hypothetical protein